MSTAAKTQQDNFEIKNKYGKLLVIRQDRVPSDDGDIFIHCSGHPDLEVLDYSAFGFAIFSTTDLNQATNSGRFVVQNVEIAHLEFKKIRTEPWFHKDTNGFKTAYAIVGNPLNIEQIFAVKETNKILSSHKELFRETEVPELFRLITYEVRNWLSQLEQLVNQIEKNTFDQSRHSLEPFENIVTGMVAKYIEENIYPLYNKLEEIVSKLDAKKRKTCYSFFRQSVGEYMFQSSYANRAYTKPRGYAGDFEMMKSIYNKEQRGASLFGKCVERYFIDVPESQAVRNRARYLKSKIIATINNNMHLADNEPIKIMSIACGPAMEVQLLFEENSDLATERLEFHFVDQDTEALKECQKKIEFLIRKHSLRARCYFHNWAIKNIIELGLPSGNFSLIYSAGLFDYLSDPVAQFAGKQIFSSIKSGGQLVIGNFDVSAPNRFGLSLVTDWHLIYRSEEDLRRLFQPIGNMEMEREPLGINLFAVLKN